MTDQKVAGLSSRDKYYMSLPTYNHLKEWQNLIKDGRVSDAISYWKVKRIKNGPDCYVQLKADSWVSPLYFCSLHADTGDMIKLLLRTGASPDQRPDSDVCDYLPFVCQRLFLVTLAGKHTYSRCDMLDRSISHRLNVGDSQRLVHLIKLRLLDKDVMRSYISDNPNIIEEKLQTMLRYLNYCYNVRAQNSLNLTEETEKVVNKFRDTVEFLIQYGALVTDKAIKLCIDHYLYEILPVLTKSESLEPLYHTQMDSTKVATMRPLLNDCRYVNTCSVLGCQPDPEVFNYDLTS